MLLRQGKARQVFAVIAETVRTFQRLSIDREALAGLIVLHQAAELATLTVAAVEVVAGLLKRLEHLPAAGLPAPPVNPGARTACQSENDTWAGRLHGEPQVERREGLGETRRTRNGAERPYRQPQIGGNTEPARKPRRISSLGRRQSELP